MKENARFCASALFLQTPILELPLVLVCIRSDLSMYPSKVFPRGKKHTAHCDTLIKTSILHRYTQRQQQQKHTSFPEKRFISKEHVIQHNGVGTSVTWNWHKPRTTTTTGAGMLVSPNIFTDCTCPWSIWNTSFTVPLYHIYINRLHIQSPPCSCQHFTTGQNSLLARPKLAHSVFSEIGSWSWTIRTLICSTPQLMTVTVTQCAACEVNCDWSMPLMRTVENWLKGQLFHLHGCLHCLQRCHHAIAHSSNSPS